MKPAQPSSHPATPTLRRIADLPGPPGLPLLGSLLQVRMAQIHQNMEAWARQYGPLFQVKLGLTQLLVVADHQAVLSVLRDRPEGFSRAPRLREVSDEMGGSPGLFTAEGLAWQAQRRMVMASFAPDRVRSYFPALRQVAQRLQTRWLAAAAGGQTITLQADLKRFTVDAIAGLAFGTEVNSLAGGDDPIHQHLDIIFAGTYRRLMSPLPYWRWFKLPIDRQLQRSVAALQAAVAGFISQARARLVANPALRAAPRNLLEAMLVAADQAGSGVDENDVAGNVSTMLFAGEDTTANTLAWTIYLLHQHPAALASARDEVQRLAPDLATLEPAQLDRLVFLEACANEAMRLKPVAPFLGLFSLRDTVVADVAVPAGTLLWCVMRHDCVDEQRFPNALGFEPQRWLEGADKPADKRAAMPFGAGPRMCPGRYLAMLEIKLALVMLLGRFEIQSVGTQAGGEPREHMSFTMNPEALLMRLRQRQPAVGAAGPGVVPQ